MLRPFSSLMLVPPCSHRISDHEFKLRHLVIFWGPSPKGECRRHTYEGENLSEEGEDEGGCNFP